MKLLCTTAVLAMIANVVAQNATVVYDDCSMTDYYATLTAKGSFETWDRAEVRDLLTSTHRSIVPSFPTRDEPLDITEALIDLWPGSTEDTIMLIYRNIEFPAKPANAIETWRKESFWPAERGAVSGTPAYTDVHSTSPGDWSVLDDKEKLNPELSVFYGLCGTVNYADQCIKPANPEAASDTAQDSKIYLPPADNRGDIARALFYAAIRYETELGFQLTDCPPYGVTDYGYRSELLKWHLEDPVSDEEVTRNSRGCSRWQGNRNIFVDYPDLVSVYFGQPDTIPNGMRLYSKCMTPTEGPTATPNDCSAVIPGGISVFVFNSMDPDQMVFFPVDNIPASIGSIYITDNAWDGEKLLQNEGTIEV
jgi:endonuclease I